MKWSKNLKKWFPLFWRVRPLATPRYGEIASDSAWNFCHWFGTKCQQFNQSQSSALRQHKTVCQSGRPFGEIAWFVTICHWQIDICRQACRLGSLCWQNTEKVTLRLHSRSILHGNKRLIWSISIISVYSECKAMQKQVPHFQKVWYTS